MPTPKKDEGKDIFISRCMKDSEMRREYPTNSQRYAVCRSKWKEKNR